MALVVALLAYLLGSVSVGILYSRWRGADIQGRDLPGGSGTYRQFGLGAALLVSGLDVLKGVAAGLLARWLAPDFTWLAVAAVVLGHCYPLFFRFDGGGGVAPLAGALVAVAPATTLLTVGVALLLAPLYKFTLQRVLKLNVIPVVAALATLAGLWLGWRYGGFFDLLAGGAAMLLRAVQLLLPQKAAPQP